MLSPSSAGKAEKLGYTNVKVFHDGMPAWKKAGNLVVSNPQYVKENMDKDMPQVLIDVRSSDDAEKGHLKGAVNISAKDISTAKDRFPADKKAPVVLYSSDASSAMDAFKVVRGWGYANASVLNGGIESWKKAGNPVMNNELAAAIVYAPKPRPGEIAVDSFKKIAGTLPSDKFILDVRDEDEAMQGMLKGAKNIPAQDISAKLSEIPKDREIVAHCSTGVRAEMAYHALKDAGYKVMFLNANIRIDKDGKYEIVKE